MQRLLHALDRLGGIATRRQLAARGISGYRLTAAVRAGTVRRVRQGHYAVLDADVASLAAVRLGGRLGCLSATRSYGIWDGVDVTSVHVSLSRNASRLRTNRPLSRRNTEQGEPRAFRRAHGRSAIPAGARDDGRVHVLTPDRYRRAVELHWCDVRVGLRHDESAWRVDLRTALAQVARCASRRDIRAGYESAVHAGLLRLHDAQKLLDASVMPGFDPMELSGASGSGAESHLVEELVNQGLRFEQQVEFSGVGRVDFLVEGRLVVEVDGHEFHSSVEAMERDAERGAALLGLGLPTLRIPARIVLRRPDRAAEMLRNAVRALSHAAA